ncbi:hypothetical protein [Actinospica acidithermotolerans]|nr:hypothetical protein [Actinospica acidithermotolerans]
MDHLTNDAGRRLSTGRGYSARADHLVREGYLTNHAGRMLSTGRG